MGTESRITPMGELLERHGGLNATGYIDDLRSSRPLRWGSGHLLFDQRQQVPGMQAIAYLVPCPW